jgi:phage terminase Nu1 subunit (DNA packaging protein)
MRTTLTTTELMQQLEVCRMTVQNWRIKGMPFKQTGPAKYAYDYDTVIKWLKNYSPRHARWIAAIEKTHKPGNSVSNEL